MRLRGDDSHVDVSVGEYRVACEVNDAIVVCPRLQVAFVSRGGSGDEHTLTRTDHGLAVGVILGVDERLQPCEPVLCDRARNRIRQRRLRRYRPRTIDEAERAVETDIFDQLERPCEVSLDFTRKTD